MISSRPCFAIGNDVALASELSIADCRGFPPGEGGGKGQLMKHFPAGIKRRFLTPQNARATVFIPHN
jgi:hypothetical protein